MSIVFLTERLKVPAPGIGGGSHGALGAVLINGAALDSRSPQVLMPGDAVTLRTPGAGGSGPQAQRTAALACADIKQGSPPPPAYHLTIHLTTNPPCFFSPPSPVTHTTPKHPLPPS